MRNAFIHELVDLAHRNPRVALIVGDLGYSVVEPFAEAFPDRFVNAGVAEQNMTGIAAGMASEGYHVFTYSIANFPSFRCAEQIRNDVAYHGLPVTIVAVGGGLAYGALGYSHHAVQDYALFRSFPDMLIAAPGDPMETRACLRHLVAHPQPSYLRLGKAGEPCFHAEVPEVAPGTWLEVAVDRDRDPDHAVLTTGATLGLAMERFGRGEYGRVYSMPLWSQAAKAGQAARLDAVASLETLEDHLVDGGFGSWMLEAVNAVSPAAAAKIRIRALDPLVCGTVGSQATLNRIGGLG